MPTSPCSGAYHFLRRWPLDGARSRDRWNRRCPWVADHLPQKRRTTGLDAVTRGEKCIWAVQNGSEGHGVILISTHTTRDTLKCVRVINRRSSEWDGQQTGWSSYQPILLTLLWASLASSEMTKTPLPKEGSIRGSLPRTDWILGRKILQKILRN